MTDRRRALLVAALGFARVEIQPEPPVLRTLRTWLGSWTGIGAMAVGMARQGFDLQLTRYEDRGWRANFYPAGIAHSVVSGSGWAPTPAGAVQSAAWDALHQVRPGGVDLSQG